MAKMKEQSADWQAEHLATVEELREVLHDLCMDHSERVAIGGGPGWRERHAKTWARAYELAGLTA